MREKIDQPDKTYSALTDITDIAGVRIITYFEDDVDRIDGQHRNPIYRLYLGTIQLKVLRICTLF